MALPIRQGATHKVVLGPVVAVGDGFTPVTNLAVSSADEAEVILHDNGTVVDISGYTWAAIATADGYYHLTLQSGISNTVGHMTVVVNDDSLCLPVKADFVVLDTGIYDSIYADAAVGLVTTADLLDKLGAVDEAAAAGDPSSTESVMQYVKQIVNVLVGAAGIGTFPAEQAPANAVSLAEVIRAIHADTNALNDPTAGTIADAVWNEAKSGHTTQGTYGEMMNTVESATVDTVTNTHTPTTTEFQADDITEATADHYNGRIVVWLTGVLAGQATDITDYVAVGGIGQFTVTAMTEAPSNNDTFVIV